MQIERLELGAFKELSKNGKLPENPAIAKGCAPEVRAVGDPDDRVRKFILSTASVDRDNDTINQAGWVLDAFRKSGTFLWAHNRRADLPPIGDPFDTKVEAIAGKGDVLTILVRFPDPEFPHPMGEGFGHSVMRMYDERLLKAVSAGFLPLEWKFNEERGGFAAMDFDRQELLEGSAVPVQSNREALHIARSKGINVDPIVNWAETLRDDNPAGLWLPKGAVQELLDCSTTSVSSSAKNAPPENAEEETTAPAENAEPAEELAPAENAEPAEESAPAENAEEEPTAPAENAEEETNAPAENAKNAEEPAPDEKSADAFQAAHDAIVKAEGELADRLLVIAKVVSKAGRVLSASNESKLREARDLLSAVLSFSDEEEETEENGEEGKETSAPITREELAAMVRDSLNKGMSKLTGRLPE